MTDNKNMQDGRDRNQVAGNQDYELQHVAEKMNVSVQAVRQAIEAVGNDREKVEEYLRGNSQR